MKAVYERLPPLATTDIVACNVVRGPDFGCQWHFHPELEIILIIRGGTARRIGDDISALRDRDIYFIGANLPHDFRNERIAGAKPRTVHAIVIKIQPLFFGSGWLDTNDMMHVRRLIGLSAHGLQFTGNTRAAVEKLIRRVPLTRGLRRLILTLEILSVLSKSRELKLVASPGFAPDIRVSDTKRMNLISSFVQNHLADPVYLDAVAHHVGMSTVSFSRYFRQRTGRTFPAYLNQLRISRVCRHLAETDATVTEIALACGFESMANFQRQFARVTGTSPKCYRRKVGRDGSGLKGSDHPAL